MPRYKKDETEFTVSIIKENRPQVRYKATVPKVLSESKDQICGEFTIKNDKLTFKLKSIVFSNSDS